MSTSFYEKFAKYIVFPTTEYITIIKGDLEGYIRTIHNTMIEININKGDKLISILMMGFNEETVEEFLNTLVIE